MKVYRFSWPEFKDFLSKTEANFKILELENDYIIRAIDEWFCITCHISKTDPVNDDQKDFEDNYKLQAIKWNV